MQPAEKPTRSPNAYLAFVTAQVLGKAPATQLQEWARDWDRLLRLISPISPIETVSNVITKWEFLGTLFQGKSRKPRQANAGAYVSKFLIPIRSEYGGLFHLTSSGGTKSDFDFYKMLRSKPLHGYVPAGVSTKGFEGVVTWWVGHEGIKETDHLKVDSDGGLHVNTQLLCNELLKSMEVFRTYLIADDNIIDGWSPIERWRRAHWELYAPIGYDLREWMRLGERFFSESAN